ncbi:MAG: hypothetical protein J6B89_03395 [Bacilli bacterium]|nr:hypothetical protein [Bacilli bacterium]
MAKVNFKRIASSNEIDNIPITDGNFIVTGDGKAYIDYIDERKGLGGTPDFEMDENSTNPVENKVIKAYIDDQIKQLKQTSDTLSYNLITNGPAIKTGRKVDGKDEWVVRKSAATIKDDNKRINIGLPENAKQIDFDVQIAAINSSDVIVKPGYYKSATDFFMVHGYSNGDVQVQIGSGVQWLNSDMKYFITVYYVLNEV